MCIRDSRVAVRDRVLLVLSAGVRVQSERTWEGVAPAVRAALHDALGFERAELAGSVHLSTAVRAAQSVDGVDHVDVDVFAGIPDDIDPVGLAGLAGELTTARPCVAARPAGFRTLRHSTVPGDTLTSVATRNGLTVDQLLRLNPGIGHTELRGDLSTTFPSPVVRRGLRPAQLAVLDASTPETLVLRRIP